MKEKFRNTFMYEKGRYSRPALSAAAVKLALINDTALNKEDKLKAFQNLLISLLLNLEIPLLYEGFFSYSTGAHNIILHLLYSINNM